MPRTLRGPRPTCFLAFELSTGFLSLESSKNRPTKLGGAERSSNFSLCADMAQVLTVRAPPSKRLRGTQATGVADRFYGRTHLSAQGLELFGSQGLQGVVSDLDIELMVMFTIPAKGKTEKGSRVPGVVQQSDQDSESLDLGQTSRNNISRFAVCLNQVRTPQSSSCCFCCREC